MGTGGKAWSKPRVNLCQYLLKTSYSYRITNNLIPSAALCTIKNIPNLTEKDKDHLERLSISIIFVVALQLFQLCLRDIFHHNPENKFKKEKKYRKEY